MPTLLVVCINSENEEGSKLAGGFLDLLVGLVTVHTRSGTVVLSVRFTSPLVHFLGVLGPALMSSPPLPP